MSSALFGKKAVFTVAAAALCFLAVEGIAAVYHVITERHLPYGGESFDLFLRELEDGAREGVARKLPGRRTDEPVVSLHPYLGFVYNADRETPFQGYDLSRFGFYSDVDAVYRKGSEEEFVVGIFGGSVAAHMVVRAGETLVDELSRCASLEGREVIVNSVSQGGYKQPQQLMALSYILALGGEFDIVVNIDGVNELVWYHKNAMLNGIDPSFPYRWDNLSSPDAGDPVLIEAKYAILSARRFRAGAALFFNRPLLRRLAISRLCWSAVRGRTERDELGAVHRIDRRHRRLRRKKEISFQQRGPGYRHYETDEESLVAASDLWFRSSVMMMATARSEGVPYLHLLQPNQYFGGTRELTEIEKTRFVNEDSDYFLPLSQGIGHLQDKIPSLLSEGVDFTDCTEIFSDYPGEIYEDDCCHYNEEGNRILAVAVAEAVCRAVESRETGR